MSPLVEGESSSGLPNIDAGEIWGNNFGETAAEAAGMTLALRARRRMSRRDRAYRPAGTDRQSSHQRCHSPLASTLASSSTSFADFFKFSSCGKSRAIRTKKDAANAAQTSLGQHSCAMSTYGCSVQHNAGRCDTGGSAMIPWVNSRFPLSGIFRYTFPHFSSRVQPMLFAPSAYPRRLTDHGFHATAGN